MKRPLTAPALLGLALACLCAVSPPRGEGQPATATKAYDQLNVNNTGPNLTNAYLLMYASLYIFPNELGVSTTSTAGFATKFQDKFKALGMKKVKIVRSGRSDTEGAVMSNDKAVIVVFRGTELGGDIGSAAKDAATDADIVLVDQTNLGTGVKTHRGFTRALDSVYSKVKSEVIAQGGRTKRVFVTGHSLGGALATICGLRLRKQVTSKVVVHTFGAPRAGNESFKLAYAGVPYHRWVNANDIVPMVPDDILLGYRHVGKTHNIKDNGTITTNDSEFRGIGSVAKHNTRLYTRKLHAKLSASVKSKVPAPPA